MTCYQDAERIVTDTNIQCWGSLHRAYGALSLIAFGYFVPLSIMVAPVLAEANKTSTTSITVSKPFIMVINVAKVVAAMVIILLSERPRPAVVIAFSLVLFIASLTSVWSISTKFEQPTSSLRLNITRVSTSVGALLCALVTIAFYFIDALRVRQPYLPVLIIFIFCSVVVPFITYFVTK